MRFIELMKGGDDVFKLTEEEVITDETLKYHSREAERMRNYIYNQQHAPNQKQPVTNTRTSLNTPPAKSTSSATSTTVPIRKNAAEPAVGTRPVVNRNIASSTRTAPPPVREDYQVRSGTTTRTVPPPVREDYQVRSGATTRTAPPPVREDYQVRSGATTRTAPPPVREDYQVRSGATTRTAPPVREDYQVRSGATTRTTPPPVKSKTTVNSIISFAKDIISERSNSQRPSDERRVSAKHKKDKTSVIIRVATALIALITTFISMYALVVFGNVPFITKWRNIWIETAMTTDQHKWLATSFFPEALIDKVMKAQVDIKDIGHTDIDKKEEEEEDILGQKDLVVGEPDKHGNEVLINDIEQGIVVLKVKTSNYVGRLLLVDDPSRVYISATDYKDSRGQFICDYLEKEDAVIGTNASGFHDPGGTSVGGVVTAQCVAQGEYWGTYSSKYITVGFDENDRLIVGEFSDWKERKLRDAFQYHPALIINGDKVIEGSSGWGLQPRTVIGQAANGVVMIFVVDGRQVGYSLGATMGDCADVLEMYGAVNAGACDGGSSSVIAYEGEILNEPSTDMPTGRYLPNAWVVARKTTDKSESADKTK